MTPKQLTLRNFRKFIFNLIVNSNMFIMDFFSKQDCKHVPSFFRECMPLWLTNQRNRRTIVSDLIYFSAKVGKSIKEIGLSKIGGKIPCLR